MKITMNDPILAIDGSEVNDGNKVLRVVDVIITAMTAQLKSDAEESGESMLRKWDLAERAHKSRDGEMEINVEEAALIKDRVRTVFASTIIYANIHRLIEGSK